MTHAEIKEKIQEFLRDLVDDEELVIEDETAAKDVDGWDSLAQLQLIAMLEDEFSIKFTLGEINGLKNVGEMCECILKHMA